MQHVGALDDNEQMNSAYEQLPGLQHIYLQDSWVLGISHDEESLVFELEFVLTEGHPLYTERKPNEQ